MTISFSKNILATSAVYGLVLIFIQEHFILLLTMWLIGDSWHPML